MINVAMTGCLSFWSSNLKMILWRARTIKVATFSSQNQTSGNTCFQAWVGKGIALGFSEILQREHTDYYTLDLHWRIQSASVSSSPSSWTREWSTSPLHSAPRQDLLGTAVQIACDVFHRIWWVSSREEFCFSVLTNPLNCLCLAAVGICPIPQEM